MANKISLAYGTSPWQRDRIHGWIVEDDYSIIRRGTTVQNLQANATLGRLHQTIGNTIKFMKDKNKRIPCEYIIKDNILYLIHTIAKYAENLYKGPSEVTKINNNGTVQWQMGAIHDTVNIWLFKPYFEKAI